MPEVARVAPPRRFNTAEINWSLSDQVLERLARRSGGSQQTGSSHCVTTVQQQPQLQIIKIKEIIAQIEDLRVTALPDKVIVQGVVVEQIFFVSTDNIVRERVERVPFAAQIVLPGVDPEKITAGTQTLDVLAEVEFVIAHLIDAFRVKDKIVVLIEVTLTEKMVVNGMSIDVVIATKKEQILVIQIKEFPVIVVVVAEIPQPAVIVQQVLLEERKRLEAIKIKQVDADVRDVTVQVLEGKIIISGIVHKQVQFVGPDNIVRVIQEDIPFTHAKQVPGISPGAHVSVSVDVEFIIPELDPAKGILRQKIVLLVRILVPDVRFVTVVTDVTGPGIETTRVLIRVDGLELFVVTDVRGPGVKRVVKDTIIAIVVDSPDPNPQPIVVVTDVIIDP